MPRTAPAGPCSGLAFAPHERASLLHLQGQFLRYFLDNQTPDGLVLDRQANFGPTRPAGLCSTAATGMGFVALALASAEPHRLLGRAEAVARVRRGLETSLQELPHTEGVLPHFVRAHDKRPAGADARSTIDTAWLLAGGLWAAEFLACSALHELAGRLYRRLDWSAWAGPSGLIRHGADAAGRPFPCCWDRLNGETAFLYVLAAGADERRRWPAEHFDRLGGFPGEAGGLRFGSADLGLFVFQYGNDLLDPAAHPLPGFDLAGDAALAAEANFRVCRAAAGRFATYRRFWGLSAGDGPGGAYRAYSPAGPIDGTAHVTATVASIAHRPSQVWENLCEANAGAPLLKGRYGYSNVNLDRGWVSPDVVGIDAGAAALALENALCDGRVRRVFRRLEPVQRGLGLIHDTQALERAA
jgi:hypothetical protein